MFVLAALVEWQCLAAWDASQAPTPNSPDGETLNVRLKFVETFPD
jgi:hypothetical protein